MGEIRKYKSLLVAFLTLVFIVYAKQIFIVDTPTFIDKSEKQVLKQASDFFSSICFYKQIKVNEANTHLLKKAAFDKTAIKLSNISFAIQSEYFSIFNNSSSSGISILKLICILRI